MGQPQKLTLSCSIVCLPLGHYNKLQPSGDFILIHRVYYEPEGQCFESEQIYTKILTEDER